jgi:hypothetical protein
MARAFRFGNYSVYVYPERGSPHHRPHAHIYLGQSRIASVFLETMTLFEAHERMPKDLLKALQGAQEALLDLWMELNPDD